MAGVREDARSEAESTTGIDRGRSGVTEALSRFAVPRRRGLWAAAAIVVLYTLAGFFLVPWLVGKLASDTVREQFDAELTLADVAFNPYVLSLRVDGLELKDPRGEPLIDVAQIFVNFQLSSLFRLAWTFEEFRVDEPLLRLDRNAEGELNIGFLAASTDEDEADSSADDEEGVPRLLIFDFAVNDAAVEWSDAVPAEPVSTRFGPVSVSIVELNTLPQRAGDQSVVIATETQGTLTWSGSLELNPLRSSGRAVIDGSHFPLISAYLRSDIGFDITEGDLDIELDYHVESLEDGTFAAGVDDLNVVVSRLRLLTYDGPAAGGSGSGREVLALPKLELAGGEFRWPEQAIRVDSLSLDDATLSLFRDVAGELDILSRAGDAENSAETEAPVATNSADAAPWDVSLDRFTINGAAVGLIDESVSPAADIGVEDLNLEITGIDNAEGSSFPLDLSMLTRAGGTISVNGNITVLPAPVADLEVTVEAAQLALLHPYIQPLANVSLDSGALILTANLHHGPDNPLRFAGDASIVDFLITETTEGSTLGRWSRFDAEGIVVDVAGETVDVDLLRFDEPYADIVIAEDGSVNLGRIDKGATAPEGDAEAPADEPAADGGDEPGFVVSIGGVDVGGGSARFADLSLPLPFEAEIAELGGEISTIATDSEEPAEVALEGKVDEYGLVRVSGTVTPLDPPKNTDLAVVFRNVDMPKMSAYSIPFAGREIASGRVDLDLGYRIEEGQLQGRNNIVLREFELGDKVPHPDATSLPLGLAVALLKDQNGIIDIDLPVSGDVNDPEFSYGGVILKALVNLVVRIAASPFALIGNLLGVEASELEYVGFDYGRADLTPPEQERIAKLAEALNLRPELVLEVPPVVDPEHDAMALKAQQLDAVIDAQLAADAGDDQALAERRTEVLEALFRESAGTGDAGAELESLRQEFTQPPAEADGEAIFDALAYTAELRRRLVAAQPLDDAALDQLAAQRADAIRLGLIAIDPALEARVSVTDADEVSTDGEEGIPLKVSLGAGNDDA